MRFRIHHLHTVVPEFDADCLAFQQGPLGCCRPEYAGGIVPVLKHRSQHRIPDGRHYHDVLLRQLRGSGDESLFRGAAVKRRQQNHQGAVRRDSTDLSRNG